MAEHVPLATPQGTKPDNQPDLQLFEILAGQHLGLTLTALGVAPHQLERAAYVQSPEERQALLAAKEPSGYTPDTEVAARTLVEALLGSTVVDSITDKLGRLVDLETFTVYEGRLTQYRLARYASKSDAEREAATLRDLRAVKLSIFALMAASTQVATQQDATILPHSPRPDLPDPRSPQSVTQTNAA